MHNSTVFLTVEQVDKLRRVLNPTIPIYPSPTTPSFPTLHIIPKDFLRQVLIKLKQHSIDVSSVRLNGSAASYVLINDSDFVYRDIDIVFLIKTPLSSEQKTTLFSSNNEPYLCDVWTIIKYIISSCLIEYISNVSSYTQYFVSSLLDTYTQKNIKISSEQDSWALLSLQNLLGKNLEFKFVEYLKRQWQFSVDSFQIDLLPLLVEKSSLHQQIVPQSITRKISSTHLSIGAINGVTIEKDDHDPGTDSTSPLQFGFFTPSSSPSNLSDIDTATGHCETLATITTIQSVGKRIAQSRTHSAKQSAPTSDDDDDLSASFLQFQISVNEDVDDGIVVDTDDLTSEEDDPVYRTPIDTDCCSATTIELPSSRLHIQVFSVYKDLDEALYHLNNKLIATHEPETIRGGGLLKYCDLLARKYKPYDADAMTRMQRYMCSRFFIDYKTLFEQIHVITQYVATHFLASSVMSHFRTMHNVNDISQRLDYQQNQYINSRYAVKQIDQIDLINARLCLLFFEHLSAIIEQSTVFLTPEDKQLLLFNIFRLKESYHFEYEHLFFDDHEHHQKYHSYPQRHHQQYYSKSSTNSSRSSSPSSSTSKSYRHPRGHYRYSQAQRQTANGSYHRSQNYANQPTAPLNYR